MNFEELMPYLLTTGAVGAITGFILGFIFKKISKMIFVMVALVVVGVQLLVMNGVINFEWMSAFNATQAFVGENQETIMSFKR
jgi:uncharacterized membrane protein (Fun14 family)